MVTRILIPCLCMLHFLAAVLLAPNLGGPPVLVSFLGATVEGAFFTAGAGAFWGLSFFGAVVALFVLFAAFVADGAAGPLETEGAGLAGGALVFGWTVISPLGEILIGTPEDVMIVEPFFFCASSISSLAILSTRPFFVTIVPVFFASSTCVFGILIITPDFVMTFCIGPVAIGALGFAGALAGVAAGLLAVLGTLAALFAFGGTRLAAVVGGGGAVMAGIAVLARLSPPGIMPFFIAVSLTSLARFSCVNF